MSEASKRKHVVRELLEEYPEPSSAQHIVKVGAPRGNNLHEGQWPDGSLHLLSMPTKFRRHVYIKRGDYVIVSPIEEGEKVKAEIAHILAAPQIRHLKKAGLWPAEFDKKKTTGLRSATKALTLDDDDEEEEEEGHGNGADGEGATEEVEAADDDDDELLFQNPNRVLPRELADDDAEGEAGEDAGTMDDR